MAELMLVANPKRRRRRKNPHRRHRSRRSNPHRRHRRRRSNPMRSHRRRRHNPVRRYRRRRSNPSMSIRGLQSSIVPTLKEGLIGATGALALDAVWGYVGPQLPATISSSPYLQYAVKALTAVAVGWAGGHLLKGKGRDLAIGGVTVATHDMLKSVLQSSFPTLFGAGGSLALSGYGAYLSGSAPIVGTATFPKTYQMRNPGFSGGLGAYLSGSTGSSDGAGAYVDDQMGFDPWEGT